MSAPAVTAFFYRQPVVLDREQHKALRIHSVDARFAAENQAVPLVAAEFPEASLEYPIVFSRGDGGRWLALALTGLRAGHNAFVEEDGTWGARYVPASVRRYPFILAEAGDEQLAIAVDMSASSTSEDGERMFDDEGQPTAFAARVMSLLADFEQQAQRTHALAQQLDEAQVLNPQNLQVRLGDGRSAAVEGVWVVDEAKLRALPDEKALAWFKDGSLALIHSHLLSLRNLVALLDRSVPQTPVAAAN